MFLKFRLVHADLSEYNVLYHDKVCYMLVCYCTAISVQGYTRKAFFARLTDQTRSSGISDHLTDQII